MNKTKENKDKDKLVDSILDSIGSSLNSLKDDDIDIADLDAFLESKPEAEIQAAKAELISSSGSDEEPTAAEPKGELMVTPEGEKPASTEKFELAKATDEGGELEISEGGGAKKPGETGGRKIRYVFVCLAAVLLFLSVIGAVSATRFVSQKIEDIVNRRELKEQFAFFIYPVVINDPPEFENVSNLQDSTIITGAIWKIIITGDKSHYDTDFGVIYIPQADVEEAARSLFGVGTLAHQSVSANRVEFIYSHDNNSYQVPDNASTLSAYSPVITSITNVGETYTATVDYMLPTPFMIPGIEHDNTPIKTMIYTIERTRSDMTITAVKAGNFDW